jgi:hypothetical protein
MPESPGFGRLGFTTAGNLGAPWRFNFGLPKPKKRNARVTFSMKCYAGEKGPNSNE